MSNGFRYEIKFVLNEMALASFLGWMYKNTNCREKFPARTVNSIYFDDVEFTSVRDNLAGVPNRKKTRLRWYKGKNGHSMDPPILEQKLKLGRLGTKESVKLNNLDNNLSNLKFSELIRAIKQEVSPFHFSSLEYLVPTLQVSYLRRYYEDNRGLRITIDQDIEFKGQLSMHHLIEQRGFVSYRSKIIELKFDPSFKNEVSDLLRPLRLTPVRHSKYLTGLAMFSQAQYL